MHEYKLDISDKSIWHTATPTAAVCAFPFYITESGHFFAGSDYFTTRSDYDSHMLIYTLGGCGRMEVDGSSFMLEKHCAVMVDCHKLHSYSTVGTHWDFFWIHIKGSSVSPLFETLCPSVPHPIPVWGASDFSELMENLVAKTKINDIVTASEISADIHSVFNMLIRSELRAVEKNQKSDHSSDIDDAIAYIKRNFAEEITIDDIVDNIHISKYHFIRLFKRIIGVTPYAYLMTYRINRSKLMLRTTDMPIGDIALACGFADTSNFIVQFKKHTGQKPGNYRANFT